jgi:GTP1/Obg family GTP-binding protein
MNANVIGTVRTLALALLLAVLVSSQAHAQNDFAPAKLDAFAAAAAAVNTLGRQWMTRIESAGSEEEAAQMRQQARSEMVAVIEETNGISLEEYKQIAQAAQSDPELRSQLENMLKEKLGE